MASGSGGQTFCLDDELPDEEELEYKEADVYKIVPPPNGFERPRVYELVEGNSKSNSLRDVQQLNRVAVQGVTH